MRRANFPDRKDRRRAEAVARQVVWDGLSDEERLDRVTGRVGEDPRLWSGSNEARKIREGAFQ